MDCELGVYFHSASENAHFASSARRYSVSGLAARWRLGYLEGSYSPRFAQGDRAVFVAWFETQRAGYVAGHRTTRFGCEGELQWLNVAEAFRGKGVADALIQRVLDWFLSNSIFKVCVNVDPDNIAGRKVYFRNGASELDSHWLIWLDLRKKQS